MPDCHRHRTGIIYPKTGRKICLAVLYRKNGYSEVFDTDMIS